MAKKQERKPGAAPTLPHMPQKELYQRVNFAIQASTYLHSLGIGSQAGSSDRKGKRKAYKLDAEGPRHDRPSAGRPGSSAEHLDFATLAKEGMKITKKMVAHTQLKLDPSLKRNMCTGCGTYFIPGLTSRVRNRPHGRTINVVHTTCLECGDTITIPAPPTAAGDPALDGPKRRRRRERVATRSKVAFHEREKEMDAGGGHVLWSNDQRVDKWGQSVPATVAAPATAPPLAEPLVSGALDIDEDDEEAQFSMS